MSWGQRWASLWVLGVEQRELGQELACPDALTLEQTRSESLLKGMKSVKPGSGHEPLQALGLLALSALPPGGGGLAAPHTVPAARPGVRLWLCPGVGEASSDLPLPLPGPSVYTPPSRRVLL